MGHLRSICNDKLEELVMGEVWGCRSVDSHSGQHGSIAKDWDRQAGSYSLHKLLILLSYGEVVFGVGDHPIFRSFRSSPVDLLCDPG